MIPSRPTSLTLVATLRGHARPVNALAFSPDGRFLASGSIDRTIRTWNLDSFHVEHVMKRHRNAVESIAYSPDGNILVSGGFDHNVYRWNPTTGKFQRDMRHFNSYVAGVTFSTDGRLIAAGAGDIIRLFDGRTGSVAWTFEGHGGWITSVAFDEDGTRVASGCTDGVVRIWDSSPTFSPEPLAKLVIDDAPVYSVLISSTRGIVVVGRENGTVTSHAIDGGAELARLEGHDKRTRIIAWNHDQDLLLSGSDDATAKAWDLATGRLVGEIATHHGAIHAGAVAGDGRAVAVGSDDNTISICRVGWS